MSNLRLRELAGGHEQRAGTVGDLRRITSGNRTILGKSRFERSEFFEGATAAHTLVLLEDTAAAVGIGHRHSSDLILEATFVDGGGGALVRIQRMLIQFGSRDAVLFGNHLAPRPG